ncbi:Protein kup-1 [Dirofilaria immitis]
MNAVVLINGVRSGHQCRRDLSCPFRNCFNALLLSSPAQSIKMMRTNSDTEDLPVFIPDLAEESARRLGLRLNLSIFKHRGQEGETAGSEGKRRGRLDWMVVALGTIIVAVVYEFICCMQVLMRFIVELNRREIERGRCSSKLTLTLLLYPWLLIVDSLSINSRIIWEGARDWGWDCSILNKPIHGEEQPEQEIRKSRCRHTHVRYHSPPTSESDGDSRSTSFQHDNSGPFVLESNFQRREKRLAHARRFGIDPPSQTVDVKEDEVEELYRSMGVQAYNSRHRLHSVYVRGVDGLSTYEIEKMFAEFDPVAVEMIDEVSCNVIWNDRFAVAKMMLEMTKPLKRIRNRRQVEEGEVADSGEEEEDGEMREEQGDDVTISMVKGSSNKRNTEANVIEIEVDQVEVPPGKWRVITKHVGHKRLIILRFSLREDIAKGRKNFVATRQRVSSISVDPDGYTYKWMNRKNRVRPGLNIFDEKGNELEWDYEHDTRFYEELEKTVEEEKDRSPVSKDDKIIVVGTRKHKIRTRGRGAKRFKIVADLLSDSGSLAADREELHPYKGKSAGSNRGNDIGDEDKSDLSDDRDPSPTPQPWDLKKTGKLCYKVYVVMLCDVSFMPQRNYTGVEEFYRKVYSLDLNVFSGYW